MNEAQPWLGQTHSMELQRSYSVLAPTVRSHSVCGALLPLCSLVEAHSRALASPTCCTELFQKNCPGTSSSRVSLEPRGCGLGSPGSSKHNLLSQQPLLSPEVLLQNRAAPAPAKGFAAAEAKIPRQIKSSD